MTARIHSPLSRRRTTVAAALAGGLLLALLPAPPAFAAPANDDRANAEPATIGWIVADLTDATLEPGEPNICYEYDPDFSSYEYGTAGTVWYRFTSPVTASISGTIYDYSVDDDSMLQIFREVDGELESVTCADSADRFTFNFQAKAGEEFLFQIGESYDASEYAEAVIYTSLAPATPNQSPATARKLSVPSSTTQANTWTDYDFDEPIGCKPGDSALTRDVWYRITAPADGPITVDASASDFEVTFAVYSASDLTTPIACPDTGFYIDGYHGLESARVTFPALAGQTFLVQAGAFYSATGLIALEITQGTPAPPVVYTTAPATGPRAGGTAVTITGNGFTPDATVAFGSLPATSVSYVSPTTLIAVSPRVPSTRLVEVSVTTPLGTSAKGIYAKFWYLD